MSLIWQVLGGWTDFGSQSEFLEKKQAETLSPFLRQVQKSHVVTAKEDCLLGEI